MVALTAEFLAKVRCHFELMFPDGGYRPNWQNAAFKQDLFRVFEEIQGQARLPADRLRVFAEEWLGWEKMNDKDQERLGGMLSMWDHWLYAREKYRDRMPDAEVLK